MPFVSNRKYILLDTNRSAQMRPHLIGRTLGTASLLIDSLFLTANYFLLSQLWLPTVQDVLQAD